MRLNPLNKQNFSLSLSLSLSQFKPKYPSNVHLFIRRQELWFLLLFGSQTLDISCSRFYTCIKRGQSEYCGGVTLVQVSCRFIFLLDYYRYLITFWNTHSGRFHRVNRKIYDPCNCRKDNLYMKTPPLGIGGVTFLFNNEFRFIS